MVLSRFTKLEFVLLASLLLTIFGFTCAEHHHHRYETTTERYWKRSADKVEKNEVETSRTNCGKTFCPKVINYPTDEIIDAVDRLHQHLRFDVTKRNYHYFFTSERSKTLARRPHDHWYFSAPSGCKHHATVHFPQEGYSSIEGKTYYIVNVPNLRQSLVEYICVNADQTCSNDKESGVLHATRMCHQSYGQKQFVVLPTNKRHFDVKDFEMILFVVPDSCTCSPLQDEFNDNMVK